MAEQMLTLPQCKEYLKNIYELEIACYQQEQLNKKLESRAQQVYKNSQQKRLPKRPQKDIKVTEVLGSIFFALLCGVIIGGIGGAIVGFIWRGIQIGMGDGSVTRYSPIMPYMQNGAVIGAIIVAIISFLLVLLGFHANKKDEEIAYKIAKKHQEEALRFQAQLPQVNQEWEEGLQHLAQTREILRQYYDLNIIYPKYRGLVPISFLYEYLISGRCFSLVGPDGAYNLYESELKQNVIIGKLDDVLDKLDRLSEGQSVLATAIQQSNARIDRLGSSLSQVEHNTALSAYYNGVTAANTDYLAFISMFK